MKLMTLGLIYWVIHYWGQLLHDADLNMVYFVCRYDIVTPVLYTRNKRHKTSRPRKYIENNNLHLIHLYI